jgi:hypothetical protein
MLLQPANSCICCNNILYLKHASIKLEWRKYYGTERVATTFSSLLGSTTKVSRHIMQQRHVLLPCGNKRKIVDGWREQLDQEVHEKQYDGEALAQLGVPSEEASTLHFKKHSICQRPLEGSRFTATSVSATKFVYNATWEAQKSVTLRTRASKPAWNQT